MIDSYTENLRFAIVKQAVYDYANALKWLRNPPMLQIGETYFNEKCQQELIKGECERFFRSRWYAMLCDIDGERMITAVRKQRYYGFRKELRNI